MRFEQLICAQVANLVRFLVFSRDKYDGPVAMCSLNNENSPKSEESPSSALESEVVTDMELTIVPSPAVIETCENDNGVLPDVVVEAKVFGNGTDQTSETYFSIAIQVFIPFLIAGFGMVFAGLVFDKIQVLLRSVSKFLHFLFTT